MTKKDLYEVGDQIRNLVQDAVDSGDYSQLSSTIADVVNEATNSIGDALRDSLRAGNGKNAGSTFAGQNEHQDGQGTDTARDAQKNHEQHAQESYKSRMLREHQEAANRIRRDLEQRAKRAKQTRPPVVKKWKAPGLVMGRIMKWTGYTFGGMFGLSLALLGAVGLSEGISMMTLPMSVLGVLFVGSMALGRRGSARVGLATRFRRYVDVLGERTFCLVEELAASVGENTKFVRKDLKKMIRRGFFPQGYLDQKETCLITDRETYQQYLTTQQAYVAREQWEESGRQKTDRQEKAQWERSETENGKEAAQEQRAEATGGLTRECRELLTEGERYIRHIHACNDRIPDEEISDKLDRLELVVTRIFKRAEKDPEIADDLKRMMNYYLPTTRKLLDAYCELNEQPVQGQNIEATKREIEATLDTLNTAFEKLLDDLFEEKAWDISSDISVLNTMLAQEGLTGIDFGTEKK